jgi:hypothetical protein
MFHYDADTVAKLTTCFGSALPLGIKETMLLPFVPQLAVQFQTNGALQALLAFCSFSILARGALSNLLRATVVY